MLESDSFWALVALIVFFAIIIYFKVPGLVARALDQRAERIRKELDEARRLREEAHALLADYQRKRREAEKQAQDIVEEARREAKRIADDARAKLDAMVARQTAAAQAKIDQAEAEAVAEVRERAASLAIAAAEAMLRDRITGDVASRIVDESITTVSGRLN